ncbi:MAG: hypothetical protein CM15mP49_07390 [Actinomycetota bacterium]|nr:MAG: hypothetical protein CM15mP49_07390 [Actinomycetota bacterium]
MTDAGAFLSRTAQETFEGIRTMTPEIAEQLKHRYNFVGRMVAL